MTTCAEVKNMDGLTLIDTSGSNDPNKKRPDSFINFEVVSKIRDLLSEHSIGINTFT